MKVPILLVYRGLSVAGPSISVMKYRLPKKLTPRNGAFIDDAGMNDATIDNDATTKEVRYLGQAYTRTENKSYLQAAEKHPLLLKMQYKSGGFRSSIPIKVFTAARSPIRTTRCECAERMDDVVWALTGWM